MTEKNTETIMKVESKSETEELMNFLDELTQTEKRDFMSFVQGIRFAKGSKESGKIA